MLGEQQQKVGLTFVWKSCIKKNPKNPSFYLTLEGLKEFLPKVLPGTGNKGVKVIGIINNCKKSYIFILRPTLPYFSEQLHMT